MDQAQQQDATQSGPPAAPDNRYTQIDVPLADSGPWPEARPLVTRAARAAGIEIPPWVFHRDGAGREINGPAPVRIRAGRMPSAGPGPARSRPCVSILAIGSRACDWLEATGPALAPAIREAGGAPALTDRWDAGVRLAHRLPAPSSYWIPDFVYLRNPRRSTKRAARAALALPTRNIEPAVLDLISAELRSTLLDEARGMGIPGLPEPEVTGLRVYKTVPKTRDGDPFFTEIARVGFMLSWTLTGPWQAGRLRARGHGRLLPGQPRHIIEA